MTPDAVRVREGVPSLLAAVGAPRADAERLERRLRQHAIDPQVEPWDVDRLRPEVERSLAEVGDEPALQAEAICRAVVDEGRVDGRWPTQFQPDDDLALPPLFSVIVPTRDRPHFLRQAIGSICAQRVRSIEVLVVDDGGTTPVPGFGDGRVRVLRHERPKGPAAARNTGVAAASGRYVAFLDDDDLWLPSRLDLALRGLRSAPIAICWTKHLGRPDGEHRSLDGWVGDVLLDGTTPNLGATAVRRDLVPVFDEQWRAVEDVVWWWTLAQLAPVVTVPAVGYLARLHPAPRRWNTADARVDENLRLVRTRPELFPTKAARAHRWLRIGMLASAAGDHRVAFTAFANHTRLRPRPTGLAHLAGQVVRLRRPAPPVADLPPTGSLRVLSVLASDRPRGAERAAVFLSEELAPLGVASRLVSINGGEASAPRLAVDAVLVPERDRRRRGRTLIAAARLRADLREHPADVVLGHGSEASTVAVLATLGRRSPPVVWQRILTISRWPRWHPNHIRFDLLARRVQGVASLTAANDREVRHHGFVGPVWRLPNHRPLSFAAADHARARSELRAELGFDADAPLVGFVGHLVEQKDPEAAVAAFAGVAGQRPDARFVVVGDGPRRSAVAAAVAAARLDDRVRVLGHRDDVPTILAALDVLVLTSRSDSVPGVAIEAQMAGTPVVSYPVDGIESVITTGSNGIVTRSSSPTEAADAIVRLLGDQERLSAMRVASRDRGVSYSTANVAGRYADLLRFVAKKDDASARVLHVLPDLGVGGAEQALSVLAVHLAPLGITQAVCVTSGARLPMEQTVHAELQAAGVPLCDLGVTRRPSRSLRGLVAATARLRRLVRIVDPDVVDAALLEAALPARLARLRPPLVVHLVNTTWDAAVLAARGGARWRDHLLKAVDRWSSRTDDAIVALTTAVADSARRDLSIGAADPRLTVLPRGVDTTTFRPGPTSSADVTDVAEVLDVISVGRLVSQKGHDVLVAAVHLARDAGVDLRLRIAGEGRAEAALRSAIGRHDLPVELLGPVRDVAGLLRSASVFALATRWEGQSNAVLEAMATGLVVVVSDLPVMREVVGDAGVLVPSDDPGAWAEVLGRLRDDPDERRRLGAAARARAVAHFAAPERSTDLGGLYLTLAGRR